jgi:hypothetical protein
LIKGMTHEENGDLIKIVRYRGKISAGYAPKEPPNKGNYPVACGFFRILKEITRNQRTGSGEIIPIKEWVLNQEIQKILERINNNNPQPRRIEICCLDQRPEDQWESYLAKYNQSEGLLCRSHGKGTVAKHLIIRGGERKWENRFEEQGGCLFHDCPDFKEGKCKQMGLLKCYPVIDLAPNPYRFETRSINTIMGAESTFSNLSTLSKAAHMVKQMEAGKQLIYDGIFGAKLFLIHRKIKSGGKDVFITDIMPTTEYIEALMEPIKRGLAARSKMAQLVGEAGTISMLGDASEKLLETSRASFDASEAEVIPLSLDDQREVAVNFSSDDGDEAITEGVVAPEAESSKNAIPADLSKQATDVLLNSK